MKCIGLILVLVSCLTSFLCFAFTMMLFNEDIGGVIGAINGFMIPSIVYFGYKVNSK